MIDVSRMAHTDVFSVSGNEQRKGVRLLTKAEACKELDVSLSTLDRRIAAGELETRREPRGRRHRVYVVMEGGRRAAGEDDAFRDLDMAVAQERIRGLGEQAEFLHEQLRLEQERNAELLRDLRAESRESRVRDRRRPW